MGTLRDGLRALLTMGGSPHGVAGGVTLGLGLSLLPIPFAGMFVALALAPVLRLNLPATYVGTAIVNPLTGAFFYAAELWLGMVLLGDAPPSWSELRSLDAMGWWSLLKSMVLPFAIGAGVLMLASAAVCYPFVRFAVMRWRHSAKRSAPAPEAGTGA